MCPEGDTSIMLSIIIPGMDEKGGADTLSSPTTGGTGRTSSDEDAGPSALRGTEERGLQEGQEDPEWPPSSRCFGHKRTKSEDSSDLPSSGEDDEEEEAEHEEEEGEEPEPLTRGRKKRAASSSLEADSPKRGRTLIPEVSTTATDNTTEWDPRALPLVNS